MKSGVYRWSEESKALAARSALPWLEASLDDVQTKQVLLQRLSAALSCPPTFGGNWDALADSLQDLSWLVPAARVLALRGIPSYASRCPADWRTLKAILDESAEFWACSGKGSLVVLLDADDLPRWDGR